MTPGWAPYAAALLPALFQALPLTMCANGARGPRRMASSMHAGASLFLPSSQRASALTARALCMGGRILDASAALASASSHRPNAIRAAALTRCRRRPDSRGQE